MKKILVIVAIIMAIIGAFVVGMNVTEVSEINVYEVAGGTNQVEFEMEKNEAEKMLGELFK